MSGFLEDEGFSEATVETLSQQRIKAGLRLIDLTSSNPTSCGHLFPKEILIQAFGAYLEHRQYEPDAKGRLEARRAISEYYRNRNPRIEINPEHIFITASTSESYSLIFSLLADPGDNFLGPDITYPLFEYLTEHHRLKLRNYTIKEEQGRWSYDRSSFKRAKNLLTRGVLIVSPHNPTGLILDGRFDELNDLNLPLICDEVFAEFTLEAQETPPCGVLYENLPVFHLNGISKMFALPDLKLGWIALNEVAYQKYGERLEILNDAFLSCSTMIQSALPTLFKESLAFTDQMHREINENLNYAINFLGSNPRLKLIYPQGGYYIFPEIETSSSEEDVVIELLNRGVLVHPGSYYGTTTSKHLLISCLTPQAQLKKGLEIVKTYFETAD